MSLSQGYMAVHLSCFSFPLICPGNLDLSARITSPWIRDVKFGSEVGQIRQNVKNPGFSITAKKIFRYFLGCMYVYMCVFAITATPYNPELSNFGITFLMCISKNSFLKFWKLFFMQFYYAFSLFLQDFSVT